VHIQNTRNQYGVTLTSKWLEDIENDLQELKGRRWRQMAKDREAMIPVVEEAKVSSAMFSSTNSEPSIEHQNCVGTYYPCINLIPSTNIKQR
jgi:hypothetical protein